MLKKLKGRKNKNKNAGGGSCTFSSTTTISLAYQNLLRVPSAAISHHSTCTHLDVSHNALTNVESLAPFTKLRTLVLDYNKITSQFHLPPALRNLHTLCVNGNRILSLGVFIENLRLEAPKLHYLSMINNPVCPEYHVSAKRSVRERYRLYIVGRLEHLEWLDSSAVSLDERKTASMTPFMPYRASFDNLDALVGIDGRIVPERCTIRQPAPSGAVRSQAVPLHAHSESTLIIKPLMEAMDTPARIRKEQSTKPATMTDLAPPARKDPAQDNDNEELEARNVTSMAKKNAASVRVQLPERKRKTETETEKTKAEEKKRIDSSPTAALPMTVSSVTAVRHRLHQLGAVKVMNLPSVMSSLDEVPSRLPPQSFSLTSPPLEAGPMPPLVASTPSSSSLSSFMSTNNDNDSDHTSDSEYDSASTSTEWSGEPDRSHVITV
jgi:hypothetical protein